MKQATTIEEPTAALAVVDKPTPLPVAEAKQTGPLTAQQARVVEVTDALAPAYQKASTLDMTDAEIDALMAPFPDNMIEIRPHDGLIYLPHIHISDRLNKVFKPGKWALVCRRHWLEGVTMYGEYVMLIRGCYVGESVGGHPYQPNNPKTNYSDTLESTAAEALRRIAGKRLSCGSQVWNPEYARQWCEKFAGRGADGKWFKRSGPSPAVAPPKTTTAAPPPPKPSPKPAETPADKKARWIALCTEAGGGNVSYATELFMEAGWLLPNEEAKDVSDTYIPKTKAEADRILNEIRKRSGTGEPPPVEPPAEAPPEEDEPWRSFPVPFGKHSGTALGELNKSTLFGFWANFEVTTEYNGKAKSEAQIAKDTAFREALDAAGEHYEFTKPEDKE